MTNFVDRYNSEINAAAFRVSTRMLGGESIGAIARSLYLIGWYPPEVNKILFIAKTICLKGA